MALVIMSLVAVVLFFVGLLFGFLWKKFQDFRQDPWAKLYGKKVVIALDNGDTLEGVMLSRKGVLMELADVWLMRPKFPKVKIDNTHYVERGRILWLSER